MQQPNFVLIMTDTQATNVIGAYGHPQLHTPNIDRLAQNSVKFNRAYTTCPLCTPARAGLFSGMYPHSAGAWTNNLPLGDNVKTLGQRFSDNGYHAAYVGKCHDYFGTGLCPDDWNDAYWYDGRRYLDELSQGELCDLHADPAEVNNLISHIDYANIRDALHERLLDWMHGKRDPFRGPVWERRPWRQVRRLQWRGKFRPQPADGYAPQVRDYDTGLSSGEVKVEFGKMEKQK